MPSERASCRRRPQQLPQPRMGCGIAGMWPGQTTGRPNRLATVRKIPRTTNRGRGRHRVAQWIHKAESSPWKTWGHAIPHPRRRMRHSVRRRAVQPECRYRCRTWGTCRKTLHPGTLAALSIVFSGCDSPRAVAAFRQSRRREARPEPCSASSGLCVESTIRSRPPDPAPSDLEQMAISTPADAGWHGFAASSEEESTSWLRGRTRHNRSEKRRDRTNWFENSVKATEAHRKFCIDLKDQFAGYSANVWGLRRPAARTGTRRGAGRRRRRISMDRWFRARLAGR